ncbi:type II secretion system F family protein [Planktotalea arctica]|uniref:type II secretion system F family protein n=1 Tax=Planktotalea arctica TaxID=1481893 RepID=UPI000A1764BE|nr:type II secretion system F family protein [Planktotalea arctica]
MEFFNNFMDMMFATFGAQAQIVLLIILGGMLVLLAIPFVMSKEVDPLEKLKEQGKQKSGAGDETARLRQAKGNKQLGKYAKLLEPKSDEEYSAIRLKLIQAGYRDKDAVRLFHFMQFALGIGFLVAGLLYYTLVISGENTTTKQMLMYVLGPGGAGYMLPKYWVTRRIETRKEQIEGGFPDSLDMMLVCVEAGQSLDQSIVRVAKELHHSYPFLADEYEIVAQEMKAGKDKISVLNDMSERCGVQDVASFVTVLIQSTSFGTSIAEALRVYAAEMRDKRVMRAEEKANKLPTKMTLATMMLTVPPLLIILVGPSAVGITELGNM